jgi:hypothetical protein
MTAGYHLAQENKQPGLLPLMATGRDQALVRQFEIP